MSKPANGATKRAPRTITKRGRSAKPNAPRESCASVTTEARVEAQIEAPSTKQERMLTLLSRPEGASVAEMMLATNWQQHSVRGFLAGTVKKKLGFPLTSSKAADDVRRYRIKARRGR
jgi:hypothetical protein